MLTIVNSFVWRAVPALHRVKISVMTVGKSTAVLVRAPGGALLLIDTGSDTSILRALGTALPEWRRSIDTILLTSPAASASGGLTAVEGRYRVGKIVRLPTMGGKGSESRQVVRITYGNTVFIVDKNMVPVEPAAPEELVIASSTPAAVYYSNGETISKW